MRALSFRLIIEIEKCGMENDNSEMLNLKWNTHERVEIQSVCSVAMAAAVVDPSRQELTWPVTIDPDTPMSQAMAAAVARLLLHARVACEKGGE